MSDFSIKIIEVMHSQICNFLIQMPPFLLLPENVSSGGGVSTIHLHDCKRAKGLPVCWEIHQKFLFFIKRAGGHAVWAQLRCTSVPVTRWGSGEALPGLATFVGAAITVTCSSAMCFINPLARHEQRSNICTGGRCSSLRNGLLHAPSLCPTSPCLSPAFSLASPRVWGQPKWQPAPGPLGRLQEVGDGDKLQREIPKRLGVWQRGPEYPDLACGNWGMISAEACAVRPAPVSVGAWHSHPSGKLCSWVSPAFSHLLCSNWKEGFVSVCFR